MTTDVRDILIHVCKQIEQSDHVIAKGLKYEREIYVAPGVTWFEGGAPLEIQVVDGGDETVDRDGSVRRAQLGITVAILMRRPDSFQGQHASILNALNDDIQTYARAIRLALDGNFLNVSLMAGEEPAELVVRPIWYVGGSGIQTRADYRDLLVKELRFTGGINDELI